MTVVSGTLAEAQQAALDIFLDRVTVIQVGDDGTAPTEGDTAIGNLIGSTTIEPADVSVPGQLTFTVKFGITSFNGSTVREATLYDGTTILTRDLTVESLKAADQIFWITITVKGTAVNI